MVADFHSYPNICHPKENQVYFQRHFSNNKSIRKAKKLAIGTYEIHKSIQKLQKTTKPMLIKYWNINYVWCCTKNH